MVTAGSANIRFATTAPAMHPATWAGKQAAASRQRSPPKAAMTKDTTGLECQPLTEADLKMIANSPAAVAAAFSNSCSFAGPATAAARRCRPPTAARNALPRNSAVSRRHRTGALVSAKSHLDRGR